MSRKGDKLAKARRKIAALEREIVRLSPAGSTPASGCRNREAVEQPDASQITTAASPLPDQGKGELQRLIDYLKREASEHRHDAKRWNFDCDFDSSREAEKQAADCDRWAAMILALRREPRPQSDRSEAQRCSSCQSKLDDDGEFLSCPECFEIMDDSTSKRNGASGSGNGAALDPVGDGKSEL